VLTFEMTGDGILHYSEAEPTWTQEGRKST